MPKSPKVHLLVLGTDPKSKKGGIATALPAFFDAIESVGITYTFIPTHFAGNLKGKWYPWIKSFCRAKHLIKNLNVSGKLPIAYIHMGGGLVSYTRKSILAMYLSKLSVPIVIQIHDSDTEHYFKSSIKRYLFNILCLGHASAIAVLTPWCAKLVTGSNFDKPIYIIPNALDHTLSDIANSSRIKTSDDEIRIVLAMSRIVKGKGFKLIVETLPYLPSNVRIEIAGTGPLLSRLKSRVFDLGQSDKVRFLGWLDEKGKSEAFSRANVFCLPSKYDSFGMGFIEAMAHGLPIVALDYGPIPDVVPNVECGILINKPDPEMLASALTELLSKDSTQRKTIEKNTKNWVLKSFRSEIVGQKIRNLCENLRHT
ncbi:MAG: glycosyltransferase family 4 protein [Candidatus Thiodiazotropha sp.]